MNKIIILLAVLFASCSSGNKPNYEKLDLSGAVDLPYEFIGDTLLTGWGELSFVGDKLVFESEINDKHYHVIDSMGTVLASFGTIGRGPNEFLDSGVRNCSVIPNSNMLSIYSNMLKRMFTYDIDSIIAGGLVPAKVRDSVSLKGVFYGISRAYHASSGNYLYDGTTPPIAPELAPNRFAIVDEKGDMIDTYNGFPYHEDYNTIKQIMFGGFRSISPSGDYMASYGRSGQMLEILNIGDSISVREIKYISEPTLVIEGFKLNNNNENSHVGFCSLYASDDYIFTLYSETLYKDFAHGINPKIVIFDTYGNQKAVFNTHPNATRLIYNEKDGYIYVLVEDIGDGCMMMRHKMPKL